MFHANDISNKPRWECMKTICSPVCYYYLRRMRERNRFMRTLYPDTSNARNTLLKLGLYEKQYEVTARIFHAFVTLYCVQENMFDNVLCKMNEKIIEKWKEIDTIFVWCNRYKIYN
eukprot:548604_1